MQRIIRNTALTAIFVLVLWGLDWLYSTTLRDPKFFDGWILLSGMAFLVLFNARKKLSMLPLGRAAVWMQLHLYVGYFVVAAFILHAGLSFPSGLLEWGVWSLFLIVALSGIVGAYLTRAIPSKLEQHSERVLFERIPGFRAGLATEVEALAIDSVNQEASLSISNLYINTLHDFFRKPANILAHLRNSAGSLTRINSEIDTLNQYLDSSGQERLAQIKDLVRAKDNLDYQYAQQGILKLWLFIHLPATYGLIVLVMTHVAVVYAFSSGVP